MCEAASKLIGEHDFRNLCKMDVGNGVVNFKRENRFRRNPASRWKVMNRFLLMIFYYSLFKLIFLARASLRKEGNVLFNDALNTFYLRLYGVIWLRTILIVRKEIRCHHIGYSFWLTARVLLYAPSHRQDSTYHSLCYTSCGALAGTRNSSMGPLHEGSFRQPSHHEQPV